MCILFFYRILSIWHTINSTRSALYLNSEQLSSRDMDEIEQITRFLQGDANALSTLVDAYRTPLFSFIVQMSGSNDADEIFQEVWIKAMHALPRYRHKDRFASWLFKIAHRHIIDRSRKHKLVLSPDMDSGSTFPPEATTRTTPYDTISDHELGSQIRAAIAKLPPEQRTVFLLRMDGDLSFKEIAGIQRTSINTALARMSYAIQKLREQLAPTYQELI